MAHNMIPLRALGLSRKYLWVQTDKMLSCSVLQHDVPKVVGMPCNGRLPFSIKFCYHSKARAAMPVFGSCSEERHENDEDLLEYDWYAAKRHGHVHDIQVKGKGRNAGWEDVRAAIVGHRDKQHRRLRRVWYTGTSLETCPKELTFKWPTDLETVAYRRLRDAEEDIFRPVLDSLDGPRDFKVAERVDGDGRRFWREVIPAEELTDEEESKEWNEWMEEDGHFAEIKRAK